MSDAARWLAQRFGRSEERIRRSLIESERIGGEATGIPELVRIECNIARGQGADDYTVASSVFAINDHRTLVEGRITRRMGWGQLPSDVRADFIRTGADTLSRVPFERTEAPV